MEEFDIVDGWLQRALNLRDTIMIMIMIGSK
jgi:hypothetical protein